MNSTITPKFRAKYRALPREIRMLAQEQYRKFKRDPYSLGLHFKKINNSSLVSVRIGLHYRALGTMTGPDSVVWDWIGHHSVYDRLIG